MTCRAHIDFCMKADEMRNADKRLRSIKESDRKQEDIDCFNSMVNDYNRAVKEINKTSKTSYKTHKKLIKLWNGQVAEFFKKHS